VIYFVVRKQLGGACAGAVDSMQQSSAAAAEVLRTHGATACTDVTGFGLLGHLVEMTRASAVRGRQSSCTTCSCASLMMLSSCDLMLGSPKHRLRGEGYPVVQPDAWLTASFPWQNTLDIP